MAVVSTLVVKIIADAQKFYGELQKSQNALTSVGKGMTSVGKSAMMGLTLPIVGAGIAVGKMAMDFETNMTNIYTLMDEATIKSQDWGKSVLDLSKELPQSADTLTKGLYDIISSGIAAGDAMGVLKVSARAASAGLAETGVSAKAIVSILNAYGMSADKAAYVSDVLFQTVKYGVTTFPELAGAIGGVVSTAAAVKVPIEELGAALATMTLTGLSTDEAVTALNQVMLTFIKPTDEAKELAKKLHVEFSATAIASKGLSGVMSELGRALGVTVEDMIAMEKAGLTEGEILNEVALKAGLTTEQMAILFPNVRALKGALNLARGEGESFNQMLDYMKEATGSTDAAFSKMAETADFKFKMSINRLKAAGIEIGTKLLPALENAMAGVGKFADWFGDLDDATQNSVIAWAGLIAIVPVVVFGLGKVLTAVITLRNAMATLNATTVTGGLGALIALLPSLALGAGLTALNINDMANKWGDNVTAMDKYKAASMGFFSFLSPHFADVSEAFDQMQESATKSGLVDAFNSGKISAKAFGAAVLELSDAHGVATYWEKTATVATEEELAVIKAITDGTYQLTLATKDEAKAIQANTEDIMQYRFANEGLVNTLKQIEGEFANGLISAEDYAKAVQYLADTDGAFAGTIEDVYVATGIMTEEQVKSTEAMQGQAEAAKISAEALKLLIEQISLYYNLTQSVTEAQWGLEDAQKEYNKVVKDGSSTQREIQEALFGVQDARESYIQSILKEIETVGITTDRGKELIGLYTNIGIAAVQAGETSAQRFIDIATGIGATGEEVGKVLETLGIDISKLPKEIQAFVKVDVKEPEVAFGTTMPGWFSNYAMANPETKANVDITPAENSMNTIEGAIANYQKLNPKTYVYADTSPAWSSISALMNFQIPSKTIGVRIPGYQHGGEIPGLMGSPRPAIVHGGEWVVNPNEPQSVSNFLSTLTGQGKTGTASILNKFEIASLIVREEADVERIAKKLDDIQRGNMRGAGIKSV